MLEDFQSAIKKLDSIKNRYQELNEILSDIKVINDHNLFRELSKELASIEETVFFYRDLNKNIEELKGAKELLKTENDSEMKELAEEEIETLENKISVLKEKLKLRLIPPDPLANKNIIVEIRAGTGGEEAALFVGQLFRMYLRFTEKKGWKLEIINSNETELKGYKEIIFSISGKKVYENLRFESGIHRVQRVPSTESGGRVHTSAVTVAVLPEAEEAEVEINQEDLRIDIARASGAGGQHVNKTETSVRITHLPSGIAVKCEDNRSQLQNKISAMKILRARLYEAEAKKLQDERSGARKGMVGTGDRSEKIRTYNFPQNRITDHRINKTLYKLDHFIVGEMDEILEELKINMNEEMMKII
jgi:peptide chain release factor 1